jgi:5-methylcytosine-specific restriction endonuclease McrA
MDADNLQTLCMACHNKKHSGASQGKHS